MLIFLILMLITDLSTFAPGALSTCQTTGSLEEKKYSLHFTKVTEIQSISQSQLRTV
ncbi:hypothetical protein BRADI_1g77415v3 [Brachypodium distachyon]|uniref:Uncharacterized protein n=1 Tax=Brachypodium distachyon TaxID=15368 RepID=A0A2K2DVM0_BRADI|nr:hypothetical protein BRADI_1g77415v3 [Brachypodium distachyon]